MALTDIVKKETARQKPGIGTLPKIFKVAVLGLGLYASSLSAMDKPNPFLEIGGCTLGGFVLGTINYFLFAKPHRQINEPLEDYTTRCNKAYWTCAGIHTGLAAIAGTTWYLVDKDKYDKEQASKKKIDDPDSMNPVGPDPFKFNGIDLKVNNNTVYLGISGRF